MIYSILKELLNYCQIAKLFGYKKKTTITFAKVKQLIQYLQSVIIEHLIIWDSITLVIALVSFYDDFEMTTALFLHLGNKDLKKIQ